MLRILMGWLLVTLVSGCASTRITSSWKDSEDQGGPIRRLVVMVMEKDDNLRRFAEDQAVRRMPRGTVATPGYQIFPQPEQDPKRVREVLTRQGYDGVLVARTLAVDKSKHYVPPGQQVIPTVTSVMVVRPGMDSFYATAFGHTYQATPGYVYEQVSVAVESVLYRLPSGLPVWSATTETRNPESQITMVQDLVELLEQQLIQAGLIVGATR